MKNNQETVLIIVSHPDDEVLGMGGTICYHKKLRHKIFAMYFSDGISSRDVRLDDNIKIAINKRKIASEKAAKILGFEWVYRGNFPDNLMDKEPILKYIKEIEKIKKKIKPSIVYTHSPSDLNIDHRIASSATFSAFRPQPDEKCKEISTFEIPSSTDYSHHKLFGSFNPNKFIDIKPFIQKKIEALKSYKNEIRSYPHTRSLKGIKELSQYRGKQVGLEYAEAFELLRNIVKL
ncbi:MAG: hypothetical protein CBB97_09595 [Candidatus Endolissoclinum sp. TMED37]|nr:MAG: hypothetical protein CBB97_09595 [Candidatus Endolissoclinum sp. TMED37]|tara:strand:+ start:270 stop:971 length:702 start_codon:yes stop_codon:yes gene_type:complete